MTRRRSARTSSGFSRTSAPRSDKQPDELVAFCVLRKKATGERFLSVKRREAINGWLDEFTGEQGWTGKQAVVNANVVRSFLIHNGVLIQGRVWRG